MRGIAPPVRGRLGLVVRARTPTGRRPNAAAGRRVAVRLGVLARAGRRVAVRAPLTRLGRRLLRTGRPVMLDVRLTLKAQRDGRLSEAKGTLRLRGAKL